MIFESSRAGNFRGFRNRVKAHLYRCTERRLERGFGFFLVRLRARGTARDGLPPALRPPRSARRSTFSATWATGRTSALLSAPAAKATSPVANIAVSALSSRIARRFSASSKCATQVPSIQLAPPSTLRSRSSPVGVHPREFPDVIPHEIRIRPRDRKPRRRPVETHRRKSGLGQTFFCGQALHQGRTFGRRDVYPGIGHGGVR